MVPNGWSRLRLRKGDPLSAGQVLQPELVERLGAHVGFRQKRDSPGRRGVGRDAHRVHGYEDYDGLRALTPDDTRGLEAAEPGHVDVEQDEIRLQLREEPDRLLAARGHADEAQAFC